MPLAPSSSPSVPLLQVEGVTVRFDRDDPFDVVRDISFTLHAGRTLCLVGESGCGKSMTALSLLRLIPEPGRLAAGRILFQGQDLAALSESGMEHVRGRDIGMIFQEPMTSLNPVIRAGDQVAEPLIRHLGLSRRQALREAVELFRQVGIPAPEMRIRDYPHQLSGGMRQRVMIAMALACKPRLLLADEPTTALDVTIQGQILSLLGDLTRERGMGLLLITHDLGVVAEMADEVGVMYAGRIVERAQVRDLFAQPLHPYTRGLIRSAPTLATDPSVPLDAIPGTVPPPARLPEGCPFRPRCSEARGDCTAPPPLVRLEGANGPREVRCWLARSVAESPFRPI